MSKIARFWFVGLVVAILATGCGSEFTSGFPCNGEECEDGGDAGVDGGAGSHDAGIDAAEDSGDSGEPCIPTEEICDGIDNNCNDEVDELWPELGDECQEGLGACEATGETVCKTDGSDTMCDAVPGKATDPLCERDIDMDCNGTLDHEQPDICPELTLVFDAADTCAKYLTVGPGMTTESIVPFSTTPDGECWTGQVEIKVDPLGHVFIWNGLDGSISFTSPVDADKEAKCASQQAEPTIVQMLADLVLATWQAPSSESGSGPGTHTASHDPGCSHAFHIIPSELP